MEHTQLDLFSGPGEDSVSAARSREANAPTSSQNGIMELVHREPLSTQDRADALHTFLRDTTGVEIRLHITNNRSTMMSLRYEKRGRCAVVRLHHMFLEAPAPIREALAAWLLQPRAKSAGKKLEAYIAEQRHLIASSSSRRVIVRTEGQFIDLKEPYATVNREEFEDSITTPITWGRMPTRGRRRSIRFGSFSPDDNLIRIHPYLDQAFVPEYFVRYIVFHEMLHAFMGIDERPNGRRLIHPPAFRQREEEYRDYDRSVAWMNDESNLRRLLRAPKK